MATAPQVLLLDDGELDDVQAVLDEAGISYGRIRGGAIAAIGGGALLVLFMLQNTDDVHVELLWWDLTWPLWLIVLLSAALGAFVWLGLGVIRRHRRRKERREERRD